MIVMANTRQIFDNRDAGTVEDLRVTYSRALENERRAVRTCRKDDHLLSTHTARSLLRHHELRVGLELHVTLVLDAHSSLVVIKEDFDDLLLDQDVQVGVVSAAELWVQESVCSILASSIRAHVTQPALCAIVRIKVLQVLQLVVAELVSGVDEGALGALGSVGAAGDVDRPAIAVSLLVAIAVVRLEL